MRAVTLLHAAVALVDIKNASLHLCETVSISLAGSSALFLFHLLFIILATFFSVLSLCVHLELMVVISNIN